MESHLQSLEKELGHSEDLPLFPTADGQVGSKAKMFQTFEAIVEEVDLPTLGDGGDRLFGGHSARVSGARFWPAMGIDRYKVQWLARWKSSIIDRYAAGATFTSLTADAAGKLQGKGGLKPNSDLCLTIWITAAGAMWKNSCSF